MPRGKLILICQSGGNFVTTDDGTLSYDGGEANAVNISHETLFDDLKLKLAEMCNFEYGSVSLKYFLPGNRRHLITLKNDKDLKRMIDFHVNSVTADIFVAGAQGFDRDAVKITASRATGIKPAESVKHAASPTTMNSFGLDAASPKAVRGNDVPAEIRPLDSALADSRVAIDASAESSSQATTASTPSEHGADDDSDYSPRVAAAADASTRSPTVFDTGGTPADTVKKRRRTASWKIGANGPTIVAVADEAGQKRARQNVQSPSVIPVGDDMERDLVNVPWADSLQTPSGYATGCDDWPEKVIESWKIGIVGVGQEFKSVKEFREALQKYAIAHRFIYKLKKNDTLRASGRCIAEGCSWRIHASYVAASQSFRIKKFDSLHTCEGKSYRTAHPSKNWLVDIIKNKLQDSPNQKPRDIAKDILREYGIKLSYTQVWRGMEDAREQLQGSYEESYNQLPWFCEKVMESNPGTVAKLITDDDKKLKCLYVSFHASVQGFKNGCRPLLFLESTPLKSKYQEVLLMAIAADADDGFLPVALAIVDVENDDNWRWFLDQLKHCISTSQTITFVSDRDKCLKNTVLELFENAYYGYSIYHLVESLKRNSKGPFQGDRGLLPVNFLAAAHALRPCGFKAFTEEIKQISSQAYDWVIQIEPEYWTSLLFHGEHYNYIAQNVAESYSNLMEATSEATIMRKIESLICMISEMIKIRQKESVSWSSKLTPSKERKIQEEALKARSLKVLCSSDILFEVHDDCNHVVNIENRECTCLEWKESGLPCCHAVAVFICKGKSVYDYCSKYFTVESFRSTYSELIAPLPSIVKPTSKEEKNSDTAQVLPPSPPELTTKQKQERAKRDLWNQRTVTCTRCKEPGHNKATCKAVL